MVRHHSNGKPMYLTAIENQWSEAKAPILVVEDDDDDTQSI